MVLDKMPIARSRNDFENKSKDLAFQKFVSIGESDASSDGIISSLDSSNSGAERSQRINQQWMHSGSLHYSIESCGAMESPKLSTSLL